MNSSERTPGGEGGESADGAAGKKDFERVNSVDTSLEAFVNKAYSALPAPESWVAEPPAESAWTLRTGDVELVDERDLHAPRTAVARLAGAPSTNPRIHTETVRTPRPSGNERRSPDLVADEAEAAHSANAPVAHQDVTVVTRMPIAALRGSAATASSSSFEAVEDDAGFAGIDDRTSPNDMVDSFSADEVEAPPVETLRPSVHRIPFELQPTPIAAAPAAITIQPVPIAVGRIPLVARPSSSPSSGQPAERAQRDPFDRTVVVKPSPSPVTNKSIAAPAPRAAIMRYGALAAVGVTVLLLGVRFFNPSAPPEVAPPPPTVVEPVVAVAPAPVVTPIAAPGKTPTVAAAAPTAVPPEAAPASVKRSHLRNAGSKRRHKVASAAAKPARTTKFAKAPRAATPAPAPAAKTGGAKKKDEAWVGGFGG